MLTALVVRTAEPGPVIRFSITGLLPMTDSLAFYRAVLDDLLLGHRVFVIDLAQCPELDEPMLERFKKVSYKILECHGSLSFEHVSEPLEQLLRSKGYNRVFKVSRGIADVTSKLPQVPI